MIDFAALKGHEKTIALYLLWVSKRVPKPSIAKTLDLDRCHCDTLLKNLASRGIIDQHEEFGIIYYSMAEPAPPQAIPAHVQAEPASQQAVPAHVQAEPASQQAVPAQRMIFALLVRNTTVLV